MSYASSARFLEKKLLQIISKSKTVEKVADELGVSRQSVHKWLIRYKRFGIDGLLRKKLYAHEVEGKEIQMDTTYPYGYGVKKATYTAIDDATRITYAYTYDRATAENTVNFLKRLQERIPFTILKIRTDQGKEFIAKIVKANLHDLNIVHRANTPYSPEENGKIERFHRTLNEKCFRFGLLPDDDLDTFNYKLTLFLHYYNHIKKHRGLGMEGMSPIEKLESLKRGRV